MISFLLAVQFLTVLPIKIKEFSEEKVSWALVYFPVVGLLLGFLLFSLYYLLFNLGFSVLVTSVFLVIALIILTGGMHLDGLSDTADAYLSGRGKQEMLEIMRDPHIGVMGVLTLISCILLKIGLLSSIAGSVKPIVLILMCIISRWSVVMMMYLFPYARQEGKAKLFIQGLNLKIFLVSVIVVLILVFVYGGAKGLLMLAVIAGSTYLIGKASARKIDGITGDTLGATIELNELIILSLFCLFK